VPSATAFLALGDVLASALFQTGRFTGADATYVWSILAGSSIGLLASTMGRLYASTYYALRDTRTPLRFAVIRVVLGTALGSCAALLLPGFLGVDPRWGAAGLTASSGIAGWVEFALLRGALRHRIGRTGLAASYLTRLWLAAVVAAAAGLAAKLGLGVSQPILRAGLAVGAFGGVYLLVTTALGVNDSRALVRRLTTRPR
jgi:putative peptidoglycan lipid II flippase